MAKEICVFCGEEVGAFRKDVIYCGSTTQVSCKSCAKEIGDIEETERCRRALKLGLAENPDRIQERITLLTEAEDHRPACLRCGAKMRFGCVQNLDNSPLRDGIFSETFDVLPIYCTTCGKMEFYHPGYVRQDKFMEYLIKKDTGT